MHQTVIDIPFERKEKGWLGGRHAELFCFVFSADCWQLGMSFTENGIGIRDPCQSFIDLLAFFLSQSHSQNSTSNMADVVLPVTLSSPMMPRSQQLTSVGNGGIGDPSVLLLHGAGLLVRSLRLRGRRVFGGLGAVVT